MTKPSASFPEQYLLPPGTDGFSFYNFDFSIKAPFVSLFSQMLHPNIILQKPKHIFRRVTVIQLPLCYRPVRDLEIFAELFAVHSGQLPQFFYFTFAVHSSSSIKVVIPARCTQKYTLCNYHSTMPVITQRVNSIQPINQLFHGYNVFSIFLICSNICVLQFCIADAHISISSLCISTLSSPGYLAVK